VATKKQQRRRQKLKRHEYEEDEEVYVDDEGRELDPDEAEELVGAAQPAKAKAETRAQRGGRTIDPPSWRRTLRRGLLFFPLMLLTVILLGSDLTLTQQIAQTALLIAIFVPFSHFMDTMIWRSHQRRLAKQADAKKR